MSNRLTNEELAATERNIDGSSVPDVWKATLHMLIDEVKSARAPSPFSDAGLRRAVEALLAAIGKHAKWRFDRMFGVIEGHDLYDSKAFVDAIRDLRAALAASGDTK